MRQLRHVMKLRFAFCWVLLLPVANAEAQPTEKASAGVVIGWDSSNGPVLLGELGCAACHDPGSAADRLLVRQAPRLGEVGARVTPEYLRAFLSNPHEVKPGTPMPDLLHGLAAPKRAETVDALVHFLASQGGPIERKVEAAVAKQVERGKALYHSVGCVACHPIFEPPPRHKVDPNALPEDGEVKPASKSRPPVPLGNLPLKTTPEALARFLVNPLHVRPSGRMPVIDLNADEGSAVAAYLLHKDPGKKVEVGKFKVDPVLSERGRELFASLGCASCHDTSIHKESAPLDLTLPGTKVVGIAPDDNRSPPTEGPKQAIDNKPQTKYLNFGKAGSGLLITLPDIPVVVNSIELTSANDSPDRDPAEYRLEGSSDGKTFQNIDGRKVPPFPDRYKTQSFTFDNTQAYSIYRLTFPTLRATNADAMQIAEVRFLAAPKPRPGIASTLKALPLAKLTASAAGGCLDSKVSSGRPLFALSPEQQTALRSALTEVQKATAALTPGQRIDQAMTAFSCYACHSRSGKGGPEASRTGYFTYEIVVDLGDEGRLPPALNEVGAKLTTDGFEEALFSARRYRTYMATRMPLFGRANVGHLPDLFTKSDAGKVPASKPAFSPAMVSDGRRMVGKNALTCVSCHAWGGHRVPGAEGLDLLRAPRRLQAGWFHALLEEPQRLRPRTRMPSSFPDGKSLFPLVQGGDKHKQIDAIWAYLSQGERGGPPDGIITGKSPLLVPGEEPIVFRTFIDGVSAHAILVGFRQRTHVLFDANRVRLVLAWAGDFISPDSAWEGRGGGYAKIPGTDIVRFPEGPPLAVLDKLSAVWPSDVPKPKMGTSRTPPGWRYLGYRYDDKGVPTFLYKAGTISVEETANSEAREASACMLRHLRLTSTEAVKDLYFRVATGKKITEKDGNYIIDGRLTYRIKTSSAVKPLLRESGGQQELLVPVRFAPVGGKGATEEGHEAQIDLELTW